MRIFEHPLSLVSRSFIDGVLDATDQDSILGSVRKPFLHLLRDHLNHVWIQLLKELSVCSLPTPAGVALQHLSRRETLPRQTIRETSRIVRLKKDILKFP